MLTAGSFFAFTHCLKADFFMASHWPKLLNPLKYERYGLVHSESVNHSKVPISVPVLEMLDVHLNIVILRILQYFQEI